MKKIISFDLVLVDFHVHLRNCFNVDSFLEKAFTNFQNTAQKFGQNEPFAGVLCLTDTPSDNRFNRLLSAFEQIKDPSQKYWRDWHLCGTYEDPSLCLLLEDKSALIIVDGCQIVSEERLEILAIGTHQQFKNGRPTKKLLQEIAQSNALPILPWGVGKWMGARGRLVQKLLRDSDLPHFFLGDNGNRPTFWPRPSQFRTAKERGIQDLPGSDPLPFPEEVHQVGSFGVALKGSLNLKKPAKDLKRKLLDPTTTLHQFGREETPYRFVRNQLKMQCRKLTQ